eukprot:6204844-Pleurochrysis_carterae.AAC.2
MPLAATRGRLYPPCLREAAPRAARGAGQPSPALPGRGPRLRVAALASSRARLSPEAFASPAPLNASDVCSHARPARARALSPCLSLSHCPLTASATASATPHLPASAVLSALSRRRLAASRRALRTNGRTRASLFRSGALAHLQTRQHARA